MSDLSKDEERSIISKIMMNVRLLRAYAREVNFEQLLEMQEKLGVIIEERREDAEREAEELIELEKKRLKALEYITELGLDPVSLTEPVLPGTIKRQKSKSGARKAKYRFTDESGEMKEWSGNGKRPLALQKLLDEGHFLTDFLIDKPGQEPSE